MSKKLPQICIFFMTWSLTACQTAPIEKISELRPTQTAPADLYTPNQLQRSLQEHHKNLGYVLFDPQTGKNLEAQNENRFFIPASTSKVPTTLAALRILGPSFRFKTSLLILGKIRNGVLHGDLFLKGTGDPYLKTPHLIRMAKTLQDRGIRQITGHFYYDDTLFKNETETEKHREPWAPYNTGLSALSVDFNQMTVHWSPSSDHTHHWIYTFPHFPFVALNSLPQELSSETHFLYKKDGPTDHWLLAENLSKGGREKLPIKQPSLATATLFKHICRIQNLSLPHPEPAHTPTRAQLIMTQESPPLTEIIEGILEYSNNTLAELVMLRAAQHLAQKPVDLSEAAELTQKWMSRQALKTPYTFFNGSGLTAQNQISPQQMIEILNFSDQVPCGDKRTFETLLPLNGYNGGLSRRITFPDLALRIRAKTGSMNFTRGLVGFLYSASGRRLIFAILNTDRENRSKVDATETPLSEAVLTQSDKWSKRASEMEDQLLVDWIRKY